MKSILHGAILTLVLAINGLAAANRPLWTSSHITGSPEKPSKYRLERRLPALLFTNAVDLTWNKEMRRWFLAEQGGKIYSFDAGGKDLRLAADFGPIQGREGAIYGIEFDPGFARNHALYVCYVLKSDLPEGSHVSRFRVETGSVPSIDLKSEELIITWLSGGHNGGCLKFGTDGYLYISTGDGGGPNPPDPLRTGQDISDLLSSVLRIDVRKKEGDKNYAVPADNPFVGQAGARPEVWAFGFRNPWRMGFDKKSGELWVADVGWELWELVYRVKKGGNYGWSIVEGRQPVVATQGHGPGEIIPPIRDHPHSEAASITGGVVYYGSRFPELQGAFIYGDWETGKIWGLRADAAGKIKFSEELLDSAVRVVSFAEDARGDLMVLDYNGGIYSIEPNASSSRPEDFPKKLSQTGLFKSTPQHEVASGVVPFEVNAEMWSDFASAGRWVALPGESRIQTRERPWRFPTNAVLARTVSLEMEQGNPASKRRLETQILHFTGDGWGAYTYRWNAEQTDADLVPAEGAEEVLRVKDSRAPGGERVQAWRYHSRAECLRCHNPWCGTALAFQPEELRKEIGGTDQLTTLAEAGVIESVPREKIVAHVSPYDSTKNLTARARSYLHMNCSHCHRQDAGGSVPSVMNADASLEKMHLVGSRPVRGDLGLKEARVIAAGAPFESVLLFRVSSSGRSRMPYLGSRLVDVNGISLLRGWIESLAPGEHSAQAGRLKSELMAANADCESLGTSYSASSSSALELAHALSHTAISEPVRERVARAATKSSNPLARELFERFLPADARAPLTISTAPKEEVLALHGDAKRGEALLNDAARASCLQCHSWQDHGRLFGPPLKQAARNKTRKELLENILEPSRQIAPEYVLFNAELDDDESVSGLVISKSSTEVVIRDAGAVDHHLQAAKIRALKPQQLSAMPEGLLTGWSAQEVADLLEALSTEAAR